ncbi:MAG: hypothetical protein MMC33_009136 [Icmadophila ericetorum]|nr:hypothetical protein [Icmadophila ericetorum]
MPRLFSIEILPGRRYTLGPAGDLKIFLDNNDLAAYRPRNPINDYRYFECGCDPCCYKGYAFSSPIFDGIHSFLSSAFGHGSAASRRPRSADGGNGIERYSGLMPCRQRERERNNLGNRSGGRSESGKSELEDEGNARVPGSHDGFEPKDKAASAVDGRSQSSRKLQRRQIED